MFLASNNKHALCSLATPELKPAVCMPPPLQFLKAAPAAASVRSEGDDAEPEMLIVQACGYPVRGGLYKKVPGRSLHGKSVWCSGPWRLYAGRSGRWLLSSCEADMLASKGYVRSGAGGGALPPTAAGGWQVHTEGGWAASLVSVATLFVENGSNTPAVGEDSSCAFSTSCASDEDDEEVAMRWQADPAAQLPIAPQAAPSDSPFSLDSVESFTLGDGSSSASSVAESRCSFNSCTKSVASNPRTLLHFLKTPPVPGLPPRHPQPPRHDPQELVCSPCLVM
ncbi:hypothetical protein DIPPA_08402 [Diplonema papillatum]|nr:hypothetical protein DIPPA_08402 [Diplonema papillatum]